MNLQTLAKKALVIAHKQLGSSFQLYKGSDASTAVLLSHSDGTQADIEHLSVEQAIRLGLHPDEAEAAVEVWAARLRGDEFGADDLPVNETYWISQDAGSTKVKFACRKRNHSAVQGLEYELVLARG